MLAEPNRTPYDLNFRLFGFRVRVHPLFWLISALFCMQAHAFDFPKRKSGLWEIETSSSAHAGAVQKAQMCIDQKTDDALNQMGTGMSKDMCSKSDIRREGGAGVLPREAVHQARELDIRRGEPRRRSRRR